MAERRHPTMLAVSTDPLNSRHSIFKHHVDLLPLVTTRPHTFTLIPITVSTLPEQADHEPDSLTPTLPIGWWTWEAWTRSRDRIFLRTVVSSVRYGISLSNLSVKVRFDVGAEEQLPFPQTSALHPKHIGYRYKKSVLWPIKYAAKMCFRPGLCPGPAGELTTLPRSHSPLRRGHPSPNHTPLPLSPFATWRLALRGHCPPPIFSSRTAPV